MYNILKNLQDFYQIPFRFLQGFCQIPIRLFVNFVKTFQWITFTVCLDVWGVWVVHMVVRFYSLFQTLCVLL